MSSFVRWNPTEEQVALYEQWAREEAEREARIKACVTQYLDHDWELELDAPDEDYEGSVSLDCSRCPAGVNDIYPDGHDMIYFGLEGEDEDLLVDAGACLSSLKVSMIVPVNVDMEYSSHWTDYGYEYDADMVVTQRGPARLIAEEPSSRMT